MLFHTIRQQSAAVARRSGVAPIRSFNRSVGPRDAAKQAQEVAKSATDAAKSAQGAAQGAAQSAQSQLSGAADKARELGGAGLKRLEGLFGCELRRSLASATSQPC